MLDKIRRTLGQTFSFLDGEKGPQLIESLQTFSTGCQALLFLITLLFQRNTALISFGLLSAAVFWYVISIRFLEDGKKEAAKRYLLVNIYLFAACIGLTPYCLMCKLLGGLSTHLFIAGICMAGITESGVLFFLHMTDTGKKLWDILEAVEAEGLAGHRAQKLNPGDVVLCDNKDFLDAGAKDPREVLLYKDRFLHMLILGPTGCGKTSQVILPMVGQDIQNLESGLTVIEPKGDLAREVAMMAKEMGRPYIYFDPSVKNCPFFNPLIGDETDVIENAVTTFLSLNPDSPQYFKDLSEQLVRNTLKVLKRLDKDKGIDGYYSTFIWMSRVLQNNGGQGRELVTKFSRIASATPDEAKENADIASWFMNEYFMERSKIYENSSGIRSQVAKVIANQYLRHILNPDVEKGEYNQIDFDKHLADGGVICISTAQGLMRDLGKFLGYFIILQFKSAVFRRPGNEDTRRAHWLYIDEFQQYSTPGFSEMLTQGRSYRVACHLATQARAQMAMGGGRDGKNFVELVSANARNLIIFPGGTADDAKYYSNQFGEYEKEEVVTSYTRKRFNLLTGGLDRLGHPTESTRIQQTLSPRYSATDIMIRDFGQVTYRIIKNNSVQKAQIGQVKYLPRDYDRKLKEMIEREIVVNEYPHASVPTSPDGAANGSCDQGIVFGDLAPDLSGESVSFIQQGGPLEQPGEVPAAVEADMYESHVSPDELLFEAPFEDEVPNSLASSFDKDDFVGDPLDASDNLI